MLLAGVSLLSVQAQEATPTPQQTGKEAVEAAKPKSQKKSGAKTKPARQSAAKAAGKGTATAAQSQAQAADANAKDAASYYDIGMGHYESKRFKDAIEAFKQSIRLGSTDARTYYNLGQSYYSLRQYIDAREAYKRAARVKPDWAEAHYQLGWVYHILNDNDASQAQYKILQTLSPELAANFQKLLDDEQKAAIPAVNNDALTKGAASIDTSGNQENAKANLPEAGAPVKMQEASAQIETKTPTDVAATDSSNKQPIASDASTASTLNNAPTTSGSVNASNANESSANTGTNPVSVPTKSETTTEAVASNSSTLPLTSVYRPGAGDVLDIRLLDTPSSRSTLFTVMNGGLIEYPLAGGSFSVAGLTTEEIGARLAAELKRRGISNDSPVVVSVRDYASHFVIVSGLVNYPGRKIMRREAEPLYVIVAEAQLRPDASRAVIMRANETIPINDLTDSAALNVLIKPGDVITINARLLQYYFIGGRINAPGQKTFQPGLTLIQAILAAGGLSRSQDTVEISREEADGRLTTTKYVLKEIKAGKIPDPRIQPGDRIEVGH